MIEICEAMIVFGRHDETEELPKPSFCGSQGAEFEQWCETSEQMFRESLADIENVRHIILNTKSVEWFDEIIRFRARMKTIETVIENIANTVFDQIPNMEEGKNLTYLQIIYLSMWNLPQPVGTFIGIHITTGY